MYDNSMACGPGMHARTCALGPLPPRVAMTTAVTHLQTDDSFQNSLCLRVKRSVGSTMSKKAWILSIFQPLLQLLLLFLHSASSQLKVFSFWIGIVEQDCLKMRGLIKVQDKQMMFKTRCNCFCFRFSYQRTPAQEIYVWLPLIIEDNSVGKSAIKDFFSLYSCYLFSCDGYCLSMKPARICSSVRLPVHLTVCCFVRCFV